MLILTYARDVRLPFPHVAMVTPYARHRPRAGALWLDSGGFAWLKGRRPPAAEALCRLCEELGAEVCFAPDYPPRPSEDVYTYIALELKGLAEAAGAPCDLAPVVHMHPSRAAFSAALRLTARLAERRGKALWRWLASRGYPNLPPEEFIRRLADFKTRAAVNAYVALALAGSI